MSLRAHIPTIRERREAGLARVSEHDRLFWIKWDLSKALEMRNNAERYKKYEARGTHYANGGVGLNTGLFFGYIQELHDHFERTGKYELRYDDEEGEG